MKPRSHLDVHQVLPANDPEVVDLEVVQPEDPEVGRPEVEVVEVAGHPDPVHVDRVATLGVLLAEDGGDLLELAVGERGTKSQLNSCVLCIASRPHGLRRGYQAPRNYNGLIRTLQLSTLGNVLSIYSSRSI